MQRNKTLWEWVIYYIVMIIKRHLIIFASTHILPMCSAT